MTSQILLGDSCTSVLTEWMHRKKKERIFSSVWLFSWPCAPGLAGVSFQNSWVGRDSQEDGTKPTLIGHFLTLRGLRGCRHLNLLTGILLPQGMPALSWLWHWEGSMLPHAPSQATSWQIWRNPSAYPTFTQLSNVHLTGKNTGSRELLP